MQEPPKPMLATLASKIPTGAGWSYEVKWDGYRTIAVKDRERVALYSRNLKDFTKTYASISAAVARIPTTSVMLDGEVVAIDEDGRPSFQALHHSTPHALAYYVFDVLHVNGRDLLGAPLAERRAALSRLTLGPPVLRSDPLPGTPSQIEHAVRSLGLEGLVAKRVDSRYEPGRRSAAWIKVKFQLRQEFVVGGFTGGIDALVVGYYDAGKLLSAGKVRAGLTPRLRRELFDALKPLQQKRCPFANLPDAKTSHWGEGITADDMETITWLKPTTVVQVAFTEWSRDGRLRHAALLGVRDDVAARDVRRET
jgi:bifunctional non-homologous end joining protein LigD